MTNLILQGSSTPPRILGVSIMEGGKALNSLSPMTSTKGGQRRKREVISRG